jgi:hypothetical protein
VHTGGRAPTMFSALSNNHHQKLHVPQCSLDLAKLPAALPS